MEIGRTNKTAELPQFRVSAVAGVFYFCRERLADFEKEVERRREGGRRGDEEGVGEKLVQIELLGRIRREGRQDFLNEICQGRTVGAFANE